METINKSFVFEPMGEDAKPVGGWWALPQGLLIFLLGIVVAVLITIVVGVVVVIATLGPDVSNVDVENLPSSIIGILMAVAVTSLFSALMLFSIIKVKMEKRSLASAGIDGFLYGGRYWKGFVAGIALAVLLSIPSMILGSPDSSMQEEALYWNNLYTTGFFIFTLSIFLIVMVQATSEEVMFRGWLFSGLSARHSISFGAVFSSLLFSIAHADRFGAGIEWGLFTMVATGSLGYLFAGLSKAKGSVIPAEGVHSGYNVLLLLAGTSYLAAKREDGDILLALTELMSLENMQAPDVNVAFVADTAIRIIVPVALGLWYFSKAKNKVA